MIRRLKREPMSNQLFYPRLGRAGRHLQHRRFFGVAFWLRCCCLVVAFSGAGFAMAFRVVRTPTPTLNAAKGRKRHPYDGSRMKQPMLGLSQSSQSSFLITNARVKDNVVIYEDYVPLPNGIKMQVLCSIPSLDGVTRKKVPNILLFLHGSFHAAWCWEEYYIPYFTNAGYIVIAPSWRGTGGTPCILPEKKIPIREHVDDLNHLLQSIPKIVQNHLEDTSIRITNTTPIHVVCHSFGGIVIMKYLEQYYNAGANIAPTTAENSSPPTFCSIVTMCSVPPSGNGRMTMRFLRRSLRRSWNITRGLAMKQCCSDPGLCRQLFFTPNSSSMDDALNGISDDDLARYQSYFIRDSRIVIDLFDLAKQLPSQQTTPRGEAVYIQNATFPPCLVVGAMHDYIIDSEALYETAQYFGCYEDVDSGSDRLFHDRTIALDTSRPPKVVLIDSPHDVMLGTTWINGAQVLLQWLQQNT